MSGPTFPVVAALLALQQSVRDPFFTNDIAGVLKFVGILATVVLMPLGTVLYRLVFNRTNEEQKDLRRDVDGLGSRLNRHEQSVTACDAKVGEVLRQMEVHAATVGAVQTAQGELKAAVESIARSQNQLSRDTLEAIAASGQAVQTSVGALAVQVARLEERSRLAEALGEITTALREGRAAGR